MLMSSSLKQRLLPLCAFLGAFTTVMTILICSTDLTGRKYYRIPLNLSLESDFQNAAQDDPQLIAYIREHHLKSPAAAGGITPSPLRDTNEIPSTLQSGLADILGWKRDGIFIETGAYRHGEESRTNWLESVLGWHGLMTQPDPHDYVFLMKHAFHRPRSHIANVCLSPTSNPKQVSFRHSQATGNSTVPVHLTTIQCFPLYSLLLAYNVKDVDFLSLNAEKVEHEVMRTLPFHRVNIRIIGIAMSTEDSMESMHLSKLLSHHGYRLEKSLSSAKYKIFACSREYSGCSAPKISI